MIMNRMFEGKVAVRVALLALLLLGVVHGDDGIDLDQEVEEIPKSDDPIVAEVQYDAEAEAMLEKVQLACAQACSVTEQSRRLKNAMSAESKCQERASSLVETIDIMEKVNSNTEKQVESLKQQLSEEMDNHEALRETYSDLEQRFTKQETAASLAADRLEVLEPKHKALTADAQKTQAALDLATTKLEDEIEKNRLLAEENANLKAELDALKAKSNEQRLKESLIANFSDTLEQIRGKLTTQIDQMNRTQELYEQDQRRKEAEEAQKREDAAKAVLAAEEQSKQTEKENVKLSKNSNQQVDNAQGSQLGGSVATEQGPVGTVVGWVSDNLLTSLFTMVAIYFVISRFGDAMFHKFYLFMNPKTVSNRGDYTKFEASTPSALFPPSTPGSRRAMRSFRRTPMHVNEDRAKRMLR